MTTFRLWQCRLFVLLGMLLSAQTLYAHRYQGQTYTQDDGLPGSTVYDITQDASGRMWFVTRSGITVYDGTEWTTHTITDSAGIPAMEYLKIKVDHQGTLWTVVAMSGMKLRVFYFFDGNWIPLPAIGMPQYPLSPNPENSGISFEVTVIKGKTVLILGTKTAGVYLWSDNQWRRLIFDRNRPDAMIHDIAAWAGRFYVATDHGLFVVMDGRIDTSLNALISTSIPEILGIAVDPPDPDDRSEDDPVVWVQGADWIGYISDGAFTLLSTALPRHFLNYSTTLVLYPDAGKGLFFGDAYFLYHIDRVTGVITPWGRETGLIDPALFSMFKDREDNLWIGGYLGVSKIINRRFANYNTMHGFFGDEVSAILEMPSGTMVFGHNGGLTFLDDRSVRTVSFVRDKEESDLYKKRVLDLQQDALGNIWAAIADEGLARIQPDGAIRWYRDKMARSISSVLLDHSGRIWVGSYEGGGLFTLENGRFKPISFDSLKTPIVRRIVQGPDQTIYLATAQSGLYVYNGRKWMQYLSSEDRANRLFGVFVDSQGRILAGSQAGLLELENGTLKQAELGNTRIESPVYFIVEDLRKQLWLGTDNGVLRWDGQRVRRYTTQDGLSGRETNRAAGIVDQKGHVWIGTVQGVSRYDATFDQLTCPPPLVELSSVGIGDTSMPPYQPMILSYDQNDPVIHYKAISFKDENSINVRYRLEGFDEDWSPENRVFDTRIRYLNLPPGAYHFHMQARNAYSEWSNTVSSAVIVVSPPYWHTWWFLALSLLVFGLTLYGVVSFIATRYYARRLEREVRKRTSELATSEQQIKAALEEKDVLLKEIHHRVKNNLQVISSLLKLQAGFIKDKNDLRLFMESENRVQSMAFIHEQLYQSQNFAQIDFSVYLKGLIDHLFMAYDISRAQITCNMHLATVVLGVDQAAPCGLIVNELVANALEHAFPEGQPGQIDIDLHLLEEKQLRLAISDNGVGIPPDLDPHNIKTLGLQLVALLVNQLDGTLEWEHNEKTVFQISFNVNRSMTSS